jgi:hypothetical protein
MIFFVAKYSNSGNLIWVSRTFGAGVYDLGLKIKTFNDKIYIVGQFEDVMTIGAQSFSSFGLGDGFVSMLDSSGSFIWTKQLGGQGSDRLTDLFVTNNNNIFIAGWCSGVATYDNNNISMGNNQNGIICLLNSTGNLVTYKLATGNANNLFNSISVGALGSVFVAGSLMDTLLLDNIVINSNGASDALVAKIIFEVNSYNEFNFENIYVLNNVFNNEKGPQIVSSVEQKLKSIEILDITGSVLYQLSEKILLPNERLNIMNDDLKSLKSGVYFIRISIQSSKEVICYKIIKV